MEEQPMLVIRDPSRWLLGVILVAWAGISVAVVVDDVRRGGLASAGGGLMFVVPGVLFGVFTTRLWHPAVLTREELQVPSFVHYRHIPVADIAGIGLCYLSGGRSSSWCATVWTTEGQRIYIVHYMALGWNPAKSPAARQVTELWQAVAGLQGSSGPLMTQALQHGDPGSSWAMITRVWCPDDGVMHRPHDRR